MKKSELPNLQRFPAAKQGLLDQLLEKNRERTITLKEKIRLERLVAEAEQLMVSNAKRLAQFSQREASHAPADAVPVTIWVYPDHVER
jgi:hypothetical protein